MPRRNNGYISDGDSDTSSSSGVRTSAQKRRHESSDKENHPNGFSEVDKIRSTQAYHAQQLEEEGNKEYYDPDQPIEERRKIRKQFRGFTRKLDDSRTEFVKPNNTGLYDLLTDADAAFKNVKQTTDATLDARLLVSALDITRKKVSNLNIGASGVSVDVDEFVSKCKFRMQSHLQTRGGGTGWFSGTSGGSSDPDRDTTSEEPSQDGDVDIIGGLPWHLFALHHGFHGSRRPALSDHLYGPLAIQKKSRVVKERRQGLGRRRTENEVRPTEMTGDENETNAQASALKRVYDTHEALKLFFNETATEEEAENGVNLFKAVVNPHSFSQTIENIFYVSFLAKEGKVAVWTDDDTGLLMLLLCEPPTREERREKDLHATQMIFSFTMWDWKQVIEVFDITDPPVIPTREKENINIGARGWFR